MFLRFTLSCTDTTPAVTLVSVPEQLSCVSHVVPRTVAELYWPLVRKAPDPLPHSLRVLTRFFFAAAAAWPFALGVAHVGLAPASVSVVSGCAPLVWPTLKMPS